MAIVVGTDFSEHAHEAVSVAAAIAKTSGTSLALVHVAEPATTRRIPPAERHTVLAPLEQQLAAEAERLRGEGLSVTHEVLLGVPDEAIVDYARRLEAQLVVASALGWRSAKRWRLGGVAERIAETAGCPFLMVRSAAPLLDWCRGKRPLKVVVGDDFSRTAEAALRWLPELRRVGPLDLVVSHAYWPMTEYSRLGMYRPDQGAAELESILQRDLRERLLRLGEGEARLRIVMSYGRVADPLVALAAEEKADLLLLGTHQRHGVGRVWHGSVSHTSMHLAPMAVACVPVREAVEAAAPAVIPSIRRVLVSTHGRSGVSRVVLGSVAQEVMALSRRPVLVIRPPAEA